jgi:hypothetical protein
MESVVVTYGKGEGKKGSVRMKAIAVEKDAVPLDGIGDYYVSRGIMAALGLKDSDQIKVTFERV